MRCERGDWKKGGWTVLYHYYHYYYTIPYPYYITKDWTDMPHWHGRGPEGNERKIRCLRVCKLGLGFDGDLQGVFLDRDTRTMNKQYPCHILVCCYEL